MKFRGQWLLLTVRILKSWPLFSICSFGCLSSKFPLLGPCLLVVSVLADPNTIKTLAAPQENLTPKAASFLSSVGLLQAKLGTCSSRLNFLGLRLVTPRARAQCFPRTRSPCGAQVGRRAQVSELICAVCGARRVSRRVRPPQLRLHSRPRLPPACGAREWLRVANPDAAQLRPRRRTSGRREREETPAAGRGLCPSAVPLRSAPPRASPPPPRSHFLGAGGGSAPGSEGLSRRAGGAEGSGGERSSVLRPSQRKKKCPPEETHKFYRGDRQPARGATGGQAREPPEPRGHKRSRGPEEAAEPPAAREGKPEPALPAKVNFNRGGWMRSPGGRTC